MAILFSVLLLLENGIVVIGILVNLPHGEFDPTELVAGLPPAFSYFGYAFSSRYPFLEPIFPLERPWGWTEGPSFLSNIPSRV